MFLLHRNFSAESQGKLSVENPVLSNRLLNWLGGLIIVHLDFSTVRQAIFATDGILGNNYDHG